MRKKKLKVATKAETPFDKFKELASKIMRVPKEEVDHAPIAPPRRKRLNQSANTSPKPLA